MRYFLILALGMIAILSHAQLVNNPWPGISVVNPQPDVSATQYGENNLLGLPPLPIPANNLQTSAKIKLGDKLFHGKRFSAAGPAPSCVAMALLAPSVTLMPQMLIPKPI